jgi:hypothetical protein
VVDEKTARGEGVLAVSYSEVGNTKGSISYHMKVDERAVRFLQITLLSVALESPLFGQGYSFQTVSVPQSNSETHVQGINNNGAVVGYYFLSTGGTLGFKRDAAGNYEYPISDPSARIGTWPTGINQNGAIVGYFQGRFVAGGVNGPFYTVDIKPGPWTGIF